MSKIEVDADHVEPTFRRLKIVSTDGRRMGTTVVDAETGEPIEGVISCSWSMSEDAVHAICTITVRRILVDVEAEAIVRTDYRHKEATPA